MKSALHKVTTTLLMPLVVGLLVLLWPSAHNNTMQNRIASSELMTQDEVVYGQEMGISGTEPILSDSTWANFCTFITAASINGGSTYTYANAYYNDTRCSYPIGSPMRFSGAMASSDFEGWWGQEMFSPFTEVSLPLTDNESTFVHGVASIMAGGYGLICEELFHVWAILNLTLNPPDPDLGDEGPTCTYTVVNSNAILIYQKKRVQPFDFFVSEFIDIYHCYLCE
ncbi:MAG: hypothetical protein K6F98_09030 [Bacteroidales bacterium]|nr:hypothetical protein [Bacteroidales bacterium]